MNSRIKSKWQLYMFRWDKIGIILKKYLILLFIITMAAQLLFFLDIEGVPPNTTINMEGEAIIENLFSSMNGEIVLTSDSMDNLSSITVYINGEKIDSFDDKFMSLKVKNRDIIEISGVNYVDELNINISNVSDNIIDPKVGLNYKINNNIVLIGKVRMK